MYVLRVASVGLLLQGTVMTMDPALPFGEAVGIRDGGNPAVADPHRLAEGKRWIHRHHRALKEEPDGSHAQHIHRSGERRVGKEVRSNGGEVAAVESAMMIVG